jgi:hypothetical protein
MGHLDSFDSAVECGNGLAARCCPVAGLCQPLSRRCLHKNRHSPTIPATPEFPYARNFHTLPVGFRVVTGSPFEEIFFITFALLDVALLMLRLLTLKD